jgi:hypothetical protein
MLTGEHALNPNNHHGKHAAKTPSSRYNKESKTKLVNKRGERGERHTREEELTGCITELSDKRTTVFCTDFVAAH